ncbi:MAG: aminoglycoside phosphotransferase family protein, partial [Streptomyces sp.]
MDEARARDVLDAAGLERDAALLALGENAVFGSGGTVVKVGRAAPELLDRARRELRIARWLEESGVPAVRAAEGEPRLVDGHPVT